MMERSWTHLKGIFGCKWIFVLVLNHLPTKSNLLRCDITRLQFLCLLFKKVLVIAAFKIIRKLSLFGLNFGVGGSLVLYITRHLVIYIFSKNLNYHGNKQISKVYHVTWLSLIWSIWRWRNKILYASDAEVGSIRHECWKQ